MRAGACLSTTTGLWFGRRGRAARPTLSQTGDYPGGQIARPTLSVTGAVGEAEVEVKCPR